MWKNLIGGSANYIFPLIVGRVLSQLVLSLGNIVLARFFYPEVFGQVAIISFVVGIVGLFANFSFGPAIVQMQKEPTSSELDSFFWTHVLLGFGGWVTILFIMDMVGSFYGSDYRVVLIIWGTSLLFSSIRFVPLALWERELEFGKIAIVELIEVVVTQLTNLIGAILGLGLASFAIGVVVGKMTSLSLLFYWSRWFPGRLIINIHDLKSFFSFARNVQASNALLVFGGALVTVYAAKMYGQYTVGLLSWAYGITLGVRLLSDVVGRATFPIISRIQRYKEDSNLEIKRSFFLATLVSWPFVAILWIFDYHVIRLVYTEKWLDGLPILRYYLIYCLVAVLENVATKVALSRGRAAEVLRVGIYSTVLVWIFVLGFGPNLGGISIPVGMFLGSVFTLISLWRLSVRIVR